MKAGAYTFLVMIFLFVVTVLFTRSGGLDTDRARAVETYGGPPSKFIEIDGVLMHVRDEGQGPPLVLLHGSRASLHQWDGWVKELHDDFRIIRIDGAAHGLSVPDASGDYSPDRQVRLLEKLLDHLGIERFYLGATSAGSNKAVRFAADNPERVIKLVLSTVPLKLPPSSDLPLHRRVIFWFHNSILGTNATDLYWKLFLTGIFADPDKVTDEMVTRYRILNGQPNHHREQQLLIDKWYELGGPERDFEWAAGVMSPVLVQWGVAGPVLPEDIQCEITEAFINAEVRVISYPNLGHKLVMEDPTRTAQDAAGYINGDDIGGACGDT